MELIGKTTSLIAFHLPQFHSIPENNEFYGTNYTEWTLVKKAKPLFRGHRQPRQPINYHYYDLSNHQELIRQSDMAANFGIDGFCYYHYWFKNKRLLEKPLEKMLRSKSPNFPYMLAWANHDWIRCSRYKKEILIPMDYGDMDCWDKHYDCLFRFFSDKRYIKIDNKPVLLIFNPESIPCLDNMLKRWNTRAQQDGFSGIYMVRMLTVWSDLKFRNDLFAAFVPHEPNFAIHHTIDKKNRILRKIKRIANSLNFSGKTFKCLTQTFCYNQIVEHICSRDLSMGENSLFLPGLFVDFDNTPRKGANGQAPIFWYSK
jgi:hypothetical protein